MRKTAGALALAALLLAVAWWNIHHVRRFVDSQTERVELCRAALERGDGQGALAELQGALVDWREEEGYTHVFIRHAEVDAITDAFYDAAEAIVNGEEGAGCALDRLEAHLRCVDAMERVTFKSVF